MRMRAGVSEHTQAVSRKTPSPQGPGPLASCLMRTVVRLAARPTSTDTSPSGIVWGHVAALSRFPGLVSRAEQMTRDELRMRREAGSR